ncbi:copper chaperone PCu(A)C [Sphingomonas sp. CJ20]
MKHLLLVPLALLLAAAPAQEQAGSITIRQPWTRQTAPGQSVGGGFMTIANTAKRPDQLLGGSSPVAQRVEIHTMSLEGGVMRMRALPDGLAIPPHGSVSLAPGGYHIMLIGLKRPLALRGRVPLTLRFRHAGNVKVTLVVRSVAYQGSEARHDGH